MRRPAARLGIVFFLLFLITGCSGQAPSHPAESVQSLMESVSITEDVSVADVSSITEKTPVVEEGSSASEIFSQESEAVSSNETTRLPSSTEETGNELQEAPAFSAVQDQAQIMLERMTLEEKIGQMILARCPEENAPELAETYHLGGYVLFARDFENRTPVQAAEAVAQIQSSAAIPLLIGVDEEGGQVNRISRYSDYRDTPFRSPQTLYRKGGWELIRSDTSEKAALLRSLGINLNLAPVCDVSTDPNSYIYPRTFGQDAQQTAAYVELVVNEMRAQGMGCVLKHFPGYGNNTDTHKGTSTDTRTLEELEQSDLLPFQAGIRAGAGAVMVSHNIVTCLDADAPASLSSAVHEYLREKLAFDGVILTDALDMGAIQNDIDSGTAAVRAVLAGNDLLCCTDFETIIPALLNAVNEGTILPEAIDQAVLRILHWKLELGILK